jgi:lysophospholipase L1-like esterase
VVMIMIGTNNTRCRMDPPRDIADGIEAIVNRLTDRFPKAHILLLGIFPYGHSPNAATRVNNAKTNILLASLDGTVGGRVHFLDITGKFLDADGNLPAGVMPDFLHPNATGYKIWAEAVVPEIKTLLAKKPE